MSITATFIVPHPPLIVPEIGRGEERHIQKTIDSYHHISKEIKELAPETIIVISPHSVLYSDYIHISKGNKAEGSLKQFGYPATTSVNYDTELVEQIAKLCDISGFPAGTLGERDPSLDHGTLVPLYFVNQYYSSYKLVRCSISGLSRQEHYQFGMIIKDAIEQLERNTIILASGDLSHTLSKSGPYGFTPEGQILDNELVKIFNSSNFGCFFELDDTLVSKGAECGLSSFIIMAGALDEKNVETEFLSYEGPFGVGYAISGYRTIGEDINRNFLTTDYEKSNLRLKTIRENEDIFVQIARKTLEDYVRTGHLPELPEDLPDILLNKQAGVFVSIKKDGQLRGCIGTTGPTQPNIALEIRQNAISSGTKDPRFAPVRPEELHKLVYSVDVLSEPEDIPDKNMLDTKRYGVIVSSGYKSGLLLPNLDGVDTIDEQIHIACQKAGIRENENYKLKRFEVVRHK